MTSASFKVKQLALAVSAIISMLPTAHAAPAPTTIIVSDHNTLGVTLDSTIYSSLDSLTVTDTGTLGGSWAAVDNTTTVGSLTNNGTISAFEGIVNNNNGSIGSLVNTGTLSGSDVAYWSNGGSVDTFNNSGQINGSYAILLRTGASISSLVNSGTISGYRALVSDDGTGVFGTIENSGLIIGTGDAIYTPDGSIGNIINRGTIKGNIRAASSLNFSGGTDGTFGTLTGLLDGEQANIVVSNGDLIFNSGNMLLNDNVIVSNGALVNNAAGLQINNIVNVIGNYQQNSNATLLIGVADNALTTGDISTDTGYGRLVVDGIATIASGSSVSLVKLGSYGFAQGQRYVVVQADTGSNYNADDLNYSASGYTGVLKGAQLADSVSSNKTDLVITLAAAENNTGGNTGGSTGGSTDPISHATTSNARAAFGGLFKYPGTRLDLLNLFNASAALGNSAEANRAGAQLSPAAVAGASVKASEAPTSAVLNVISQRSDVVRAASASGVATGDDYSGIEMWGRGFGGVASLDDSTDASGYDARFGGLLVGADAAVSEQLRLGGAVSYAGTAVDSTGDNTGSKVNIKSYGLFGYANFDAQPWYVDISTGVVRHQYDSKRVIDFNGFGSNATGSFNGTQYIVSGQAGYPFQLGSSATTLTPIAGLAYSVLHQDGYSEKGGNGAGLTVDGVTSTSLKSDLALKLEHSFKTVAGDVVPFAQAGWRHEFHDDALQSVASFSADSTGSTSFVSTGAKPVRDTALFSVGTSLVRNDNLSLSVTYTGEAARSYESHTGNLLVRWQF